MDVSVAILVRIVCWGFILAGIMLAQPLDLNIIIALIFFAIAGAIAATVDASK